MTYYNNFSSWASVVDAFSLTGEAAKEPDEVLLADYNIDGYEGAAALIFRNGDTFTLVEGSHCSCYGLNECWEPETYTHDELIEALQKRGDSWGVLYVHKKEVLDKLYGKIVS